MTIRAIPWAAALAACLLAFVLYSCTPRELFIASDEEKKAVEDYCFKKDKARMRGVIRDFNLNKDQLTDAYREELEAACKKGRTKRQVHKWLRQEKKEACPPSAKPVCGSSPYTEPKCTKETAFTGNAYGDKHWKCCVPGTNNCSYNSDMPARQTKWTCYTPSWANAGEIVITSDGTESTVITGFHTKEAAVAACSARIPECGNNGPCTVKRVRT